METELLYQGEPVHMLRGERGRRILRHMASEFNRTKYSPELKEDRARCEASAREVEKWNKAAKHHGYINPNETKQTEQTEQTEMNITDDMLPKSEGNYINKIEPNNSIKVLFLGDPIPMWEWWTGDEGEKKPSRLALSEELPKEAQHKAAGLKMVWAFAVLDLGDARKKVYTISQKGIQKEISIIAKDGDFDLDRMPVKISRTGSGPTDTRYSVQVMPAIELTDEQKEATETHCDLAKLLEEGGDPFDDGMPF